MDEKFAVENKTDRAFIAQSAFLWLRFSCLAVYTFLPKEPSLRKSETSILPLIYEVVENPDNWHRVLEELCEITGAAKAVLFLRDRMTAELVIPAQMREGFDSPLLYNFDEEFVQSFLDIYREHDPWTSIEKLYHPSQPYALSTYLPHEKLVASRFWEWLEPQGIGDTVVAEIGALQNEWISLNMYFAHDDDHTRKRVLDSLAVLLPHIRKAWRAGEIVREGTLAIDRSQRFLETNSEAVILIDKQGSVVSANKKALRLADCPIRLSKNKFHFKSKKTQKEITGILSKVKKTGSTPLEVGFTIPGYSVTLSPVGEVENILGMDSTTYHLILKSNNMENDLLLRPIWESSKLTTAERELVHHLALGGKIKDFSGKKEISAHGADSRWRNIKDKLDVEHPREIFAFHRVYLAHNHDYT